VLTAAGSGWDASNVFNPAAVAEDEGVTLLYRGETPSPQAGPRNLVSALGLAFSDDGVVFRRHGRPVLTGEEWYERTAGCEDPRVVRIEGRYVLTYTAFDGTTARLCLADSDDLRTWTKRGPMFSGRGAAEAPAGVSRDAKFEDLGWTKSGAILPEQVHGRWWMYFGDTDIWAAWSEDLIDWIRVPQPVLQRRPGRFDSRLVEPGPPPLLTSQGILLIYNAADDDLRYSVAQCLIDPEQPTQVIRRSGEPLLEPETFGERSGEVPNVVFAEGLVRFRGRWLLYYGMADSAIGLAYAVGDLSL
jgi:predicted GH43/DUF377 family glycosyl hydrolase